jgi:hypothetical protein
VGELLGGILLPSSVLSSAWFQSLAVFVALNTLVYVGLTCAKLVRWPSQLHPADVPRLTGAPDPLHAPEVRAVDAAEPDRPDDDGPAAVRDPT